MDISRKLQNFPTLVFCARGEGFSLELGTGAEDQKTRMVVLPDRERSLTISSAVWMQSTNVSDGRTETGSQQRPRLRTKSPSKNTVSTPTSPVLFYDYSGRS